MGVVLIAFERESEQSSLEQLLGGRGHRVVKYGNGLAALDAARRDPPDLIVSDIVLPRMDGFALCRKWKQDERLQSVPFVFYTRRHDDPKYERFALELGAERFLARSMPPEKLLTAVDELLAGTPARANATMPMRALDEAKVQQTLAAEQAQQAQALAIERAQQSQAKLQEQLAELQAANVRLADSEARFRRVFEANPVPMWIEDHATGGFIAVNDATLALYGYTRAEFLALRVNALSPDGEPAQSDARGIVTHRRKDGAALFVARTTQDMDFDGRRAALVSSYDLTEGALREQQLQDQAVGHRAVFDAAADGCWILDGEGRILDANPAYCRMSGYSREALLAMRSTDIEEQSAGETTMRLQLGRVAGGGRYETKHKRADGSLLDVEVSVGVPTNDRGDSIVLIRDQSQRRRELVAQRQLQMQSDFLIELFKHADGLDEPSIVRRLVEQAADATSSPLAYFYWVDPTRKTLALAGWREHGEQHTTSPNETEASMQRAGAFAECIRAQHPVMSNDASPKPQDDGLPDLERYLAVPLVANEQTVAILWVANRASAYDSGDQQPLATLGDGAWRILQAKRTHAKTLSAMQRTDVALHGLIESFVRMGERHDPYTAGSARRLAALAVALGREAGLDGERQHALRIAALLHDIGNIVVPATILAKPAPLSETELALMRTHVEEGCQLLAEIDFGAPIADIVYQHHERFDGSGYPRGLKGDEILLEARILGIADTVEAMCSPRPYRPAAGMDAAIDEINRGAGQLYDLQLVTACTRLVRQHGFMLPE